MLSYIRTAEEMKNNISSFNEHKWVITEKDGGKRPTKWFKVFMNGSEEPVYIQGRK